MQRTGSLTSMGVAIIALATLALSATAEAQRTVARAASAGSTRREAVGARRQGIMLGVHTIAAPGVGIVGDELGLSLHTNMGPGLGVMLGYEFNPMFSVFTSLDLAKQSSSSSDVEGSFGLAHYEFGARANFPLGSPSTVPYASVSVGHRALGSRLTSEEEGQHDVSFSGGMFALGGGVQHFLSPKLALDGGVELGMGKLGHVTADGDEEDIVVTGTTSVRLRFGVTWRP
jgi:hypothetical protein